MEIRDASDVERYLESFIDYERRRRFDYGELGLERIRGLLERVGNPQSDLPSVHIAGSKGKGTVALCAEALLRAAGVRTGCYTSPHLVRWSERFRIDGEPVDERGLVAGLRGLYPVLEELRADSKRHPSFFDVSTALAFRLFHDAKVDASVIEVGLGGRIDSTNVTRSRVSVLTSVQLEHTEQLGETLAEIAREKVGIARAGVPLLHGPLEPEALEVVLALSAAHDFDAEEVRAHPLEASAAGQRLALWDGRELWTRVCGAHQAGNVALAIRAVEQFLGRGLAPGELDALAELRIPGRFDAAAPGLLVDTAHTPDSARALARAIAERWPGRRCVLLLSLSRDKDAAGVLSALAPLARACVTTRAEPHRSRSAEELEALAWACGIETAQSEPEPMPALARARALCQTGELLLVAGSVYLAGRVLQAVRDEREPAGAAGAGIRVRV